MFCCYQSLNKTKRKREDSIFLSQRAWQRWRRRTSKGDDACPHSPSDPPPHSTCQLTPSSLFVDTDATMGTKGLPLWAKPQARPLRCRVIQCGLANAGQSPLDYQPGCINPPHTHTRPLLHCSTLFCSHNGTSHFGSNFQKGEADQK